MSGYIHNFNKPTSEQDPRTQAKEEPTAPVKRLTAHSGLEIRMHEEIIQDDDSRIRVKKRNPGDPEVRIRAADMKSWQAVKEDRDEDE